MIMAAPFPSGVSQNVQVFLPLTDLGYRIHSCDFRADAHMRRGMCDCMHTQNILVYIYTEVLHNFFQ